MRADLSKFTEEKNRKTAELTLTIDQLQERNKANEFQIAQLSEQIERSNIKHLEELQGLKDKIKAKSQKFEETFDKLLEKN